MSNSLVSLGQPQLAVQRLLAALQLADSFFPIGLYTQSHGLESFVMSGAVSAEQIARLLTSYLRHTAGPGGAPGRAPLW